VPTIQPSAPPSADVASPAAGPSASVAPSASADPSGALFHIGETAPSLVVPQVGGGTIDLTNLAGKPVWVNFMGTYCPPCVDEFPLMNGFAARYADTGLVILAIDVKEEEGVVAAFAEELGATFPLGLDADGSAAADWDAIALPVHFWIDAEGVIRDGALGGIGPDVMARGLQSILPGVTVTPT
jgi:cytochrome c biogenesis protein CcmG/thiol:disulfide interchange protein DsbE